MKRFSGLRLLVEILVFVIVAVGLLFHTGFGSVCSLGWNAVAAICPLGALETLIAGRTFAPSTLICLAITVVLVIIFGRAFCSWICPVPLMRRIFGGKKSLSKQGSDAKIAAASLETCDETTEQHGDTAVPTVQAACSEHECADCSKVSCAEMRKHIVQTSSVLKTSRFDTRFAVLVAALASAAIMGFPVFCLICPVGLSIATFIGIWRLITLNEGSWMLLVFPVIIVIELVFLRKWCHRFCPMGALLSLIAKGNKTLRPNVDSRKCVRLSGKRPCHACYDACPEGIDLQDLRASVSRSECTKCCACVEACPEKAINISVFPKKNPSDAMNEDGGIHE